MANFNSNYWYHLFVNQNKDIAVTGTNLFNHNGTTGAVFFGGVATANSTQRWQWYGIDTTTYVLRCKEGGPNAFLGTKFEPKETTPGHTQALMVRGNVSDDSVFWNVTPWGDGTFYLTNKENGTDWHLNKKGDGGVSLSSNITLPQNGQRWSFAAIEPINDDSFATVDLPSMSTSAPSTNPSSTKTPPLIPTSDPKSDRSSLSTGAKAGIGAGVGLVAIVALVVLGLFLWRRRKQQTQNAHTQNSKHIETEQYTSLPHELTDESRAELGYENGDRAKYGHRGEVAYEMPVATQPVEATRHEMPGAQVQSPVELPNQNATMR